MFKKILKRLVEQELGIIDNIKTKPTNPLPLAKDVNKLSPEELLKRNIEKQSRILYVYKDLLNKINTNNISDETREMFENLLMFLRRQDAISFYKEILNIPEQDIRKILIPFNLMRNYEKVNTYTLRTSFEVTKKVIDKIIDIVNKKLNGDEVELTDEHIEKYLYREVEDIEEQEIPLMKSQSREDYLEKHKRKQKRKHKDPIPEPVLEKEDLQEIIDNKKEVIEELIKELYPYVKEKLNIEKECNITFQEDEQNSKNPLGDTAYYNPEDFTITVFVSDRHPKDILKSVVHEMIHHKQNCEGKFNGSNLQTEEGYAQKNSDLRELEEEAYLKGSMLFRDWEDNRKKEMKESIQTCNLKDFDPEKVKQIDPEQLKIGTKIEKEHTEDENLAKKIAISHLLEDPNYYKILTKVGL